MLSSLDLASVPFSPLVLADCLLTLAKEADQAGYRESASRLLSTAYAVLDNEKGAADAAYHQPLISKRRGTKVFGLP